MPAFRLTTNRRQTEQWERAALAALRAGKVDTALDAYATHDRVRRATTAHEARQAMVADWWAATVAGERTLMLAARWSDVEDLNSLARMVMVTGDQLHGPELVTGDRAFASGDRVLALRNNYRLGLRNGTLAMVVAVDTDGRTLDVRTDSGADITIPTKYLDPAISYTATP
jgi:ATP-dependent exoDNAse (exonuclease V) alpha subunit